MKIKKAIVYGRLSKEVSTYLTERLRDVKFDFCLEEDYSPNLLDDYDTYISFKSPPDDNYGKIKWVHSLGGGVDSFLFNKAFPKDIILSRTKGDFGRKISEYCLARALMYYQNIRYYEENQNEGIWAQKNADLLCGKKITILGTGEIGTKVAQIFKLMECKVYGLSLTGTMKKGFDAVYKFSDFRKISNDTNVLIIVAPLTSKTKELIDFDFLKNFNNVLLINAGRGAIINEYDLLEAVNSGYVSCACLDVFSTEPLNEKSPFWGNRKFVISPHVAALTSVEEAGEAFIQVYYKIINGFKSELIVDSGKEY
ncbi:MAG: hypothetical protein JXR48_05090 [Candidatus Delongbacteria bacterium]|nr:hypothetical protein [Candidatus Delongbacteria bacterium]MBN2834324.1 hypothetical protein [Candidatus Delongbacteria bacterium]